MTTTLRQPPNIDHSVFVHTRNARGGGRAREEEEAWSLLLTSRNLLILRLLNRVLIILRPLLQDMLLEEIDSFSANTSAS